MSSCHSFTHCDLFLILILLNINLAKSRISELMSLHSLFSLCHPHYMLCKCWVSYLLQGKWKFTMLYLQQIVFVFILNSMLAETNDTVFATQNGVVHWALGPWMDPRGFHKSIIPLLVSALQAGGSYDCGHTVRLPVWMNCSKVMSCTKSLPGNKAWTDFDALQLRQEFCLWTTNTGTPARYFLARLRPHAAGAVLLLIDNF